MKEIKPIVTKQRKIKAKRFTGKTAKGSGMRHRGKRVYCPTCERMDSCKRKPRGVRGKCCRYRKQAPVGLKVVHV